MSSPIPPPPDKPDPSECCGSGCVPCILDYYYDSLSEWEKKYGLTLAEFLANRTPEAVQSE